MDSRHKVLIVDDDPGVLELFRELLSHLPSKPEIFTANSGSKALSLLKSEPFRLMLCDLKMPRMDGLQVLAIVRRSFPELRTVVVTAVENEDFRSRAYALGVDLFWYKADTQQNMEMFLQCIESLLGRENDRGFRGIQSKGLMDLIQMECLSQSSTVLRITRGSLVGRIWISGGELIDAETDGVRGEPAFRRILSWKSGTFENMPSEPARERTITKPVNALLLETAQVIDEIASPGHAGGESGSDAAHRTTVWRLAALTKAGADYVVTLSQAKDSPAEAWGTESTKELAGWMAQALQTCQQLASLLPTGPLQFAQARGAEQRLAILPHEQKTFLIGWPADTKEADLKEQAKQLVAAWDS